MGFNWLYMYVVILLLLDPSSTGATQLQRNCNPTSRERRTTVALESDDLCYWSVPLQQCDCNATCDQLSKDQLQSNCVVSCVAWSGCSCVAVVLHQWTKGLRYVYNRKTCLLSLKVQFIYKFLVLTEVCCRKFITKCYRQLYFKTYFMFRCTSHTTNVGNEASGWEAAIETYCHPDTVWYGYQRGYTKCYWQCNGMQLFSYVLLYTHYLSINVIKEKFQFL